MARYRMTPARRAALRKAQAASARKRRGKGKGRISSKTRRNIKAGAKLVGYAAAGAGIAAGIGVAGGAAILHSQTKTQRGKRSPASALRVQRRSAKRANRKLPKKAGIHNGSFSMGPRYVPPSSRKIKKTLRGTRVKR